MWTWCNPRLLLCLHFNMLLLNHTTWGVICVRLSSLHFNMLLLNRSQPQLDSEFRYQFTFQYASIKPCIVSGSFAHAFAFTFQYASIKPCETDSDGTPKIKFTFQYASIKPRCGLDVIPDYFFVYISICFY